MKVLAFFGQQQSGKTTAAQHLVTNKGFQRLSFADTLYDMMGVLLQGNLRQQDKEVGQVPLEGKSIRYAMQTLGTEWGRNMLGQNIWVTAMAQKLKALELTNANIVIDDCRFFNEYEMLQTFDCKFIEIVRPGLPDTVGSHASEREWTSFTPNLSIENCGSEESFLNSLPTLK